MTTDEIKARNRLSQAKKRARERAWLKANKYTSWEAVHTAIIKGELLLLKPTSKYIKDYTKK